MPGKASNVDWAARAACSHLHAVGACPTLVAALPGTGGRRMHCRRCHAGASPRMAGRPCSAGNGQTLLTRRDLQAQRRACVALDVSQVVHHACDTGKGVRCCTTEASFRLGSALSLNAIFLVCCVWEPGTCWLSVVWLAGPDRCRMCVRH